MERLLEKVIALFLHLRKMLNFHKSIYILHLKSYIFTKN